MSKTNLLLSEIHVADEGCRLRRAPARPQCGGLEVMPDVGCRLRCAPAQPQCGFDERVESRVVGAAALVVNELVLE